MLPSGNMMCFHTDAPTAWANDRGHCTTRATVKTYANCPTRIGQNPPNSDNPTSVHIGGPEEGQRAGLQRRVEE
jgi:hypothetical protein